MHILPTWFVSCLASITHWHAGHVRGESHPHSVHLELEDLEDRTALSAGVDLAVPYFSQEHVGHVEAVHTEVHVNLGQAAPTAASTAVASQLAPQDLTVAMNRITPGIHSAHNAEITWFASNLQDPGVRNLALRLAADHVFSRSDTIQLFREVEAGGISARELGDLRTVVSHGAQLGIPDYVQDLAKKVVLGDPANAEYQDHALGNLHAGSSGLQMERLIDKWFLGTDHPAATSDLHYTRAAGTLFGSGPSVTDVRQGAPGDGYLMAGLGELAARDPQAIRHMFIDNGDGTYTVRFVHDGKPTYVTVDRYLPATGDNTFAYANAGASVRNPSNKLWVALAEKAYAQLAESGWSRPHSVRNAYDALDVGWEGDVVHQVTGARMTFQMFDGRTTDRQALLGAWRQGKLVTLSSKPVVAPTLVANQSYSLVGYDAASGHFRLYNPWGHAQEVTWAEVEANFVGWSSSTTRLSA